MQRIKMGLRQHFAEIVSRQGRWLRQKVQGYFLYHAVPSNRAALETVRREVNRLWLRALGRRSQRHAMPWSRLQG